MPDDLDHTLRSSRPATAPRDRHAARIEVRDRTGRLDPQTIAALSTQIEAALTHLDADGEVRVAVLDDAAMADAHVRYSRVQGTTDVLTFDLRESPHDPLDTDILICLDEAQRRAAELDHPAHHELLLYAIHGILHCLGEDDHDERAYAQMHRREDDILRAIGVGPVFAPNPTPTNR